MRRRAVPYKFKPVHAAIPSEWRELKLYKRLLLRELWAASDVDQPGYIATIGANDPYVRLVRDLDIVDRRDRQHALKAVRELGQQGFLTPVAGGIQVNTVAVRERTLSGLSADAPGALQVRRPPSSVREQQPKSSKTLDVDPTDRSDQIRERDGRACTRPRSTLRSEGEWAARRPGHPMHAEPPPDVPLPEPPRRSAMAVGLEWYAEVTGRTVFDCRRRAVDEAAYAAIGAKPDAERREVAANLRERIRAGADTFLSEGIRRLNPDHFQHRWVEYRDGKPGNDAKKPLRRTAPIYEEPVPHPDGVEGNWCSPTTREAFIRGWQKTDPERAAAARKAADKWDAAIAVRRAARAAQKPQVAHA